MDTPPLLRGMLYCTSRATRCPNFSQCHSCKCCDNFNPHNAMCQYCEHRKTTRKEGTEDQYYSSRCTHTDKHQASFILIEQSMRRPMSHVDDRLAVNETYTSYDNELALAEADNIIAETIGRAKDERDV